MSTRRETIRFTDWTIVEETGSTGLTDDRRPFFGGADVDTRMSAIRKHINHIRRNWDQYDLFMAELSRALSPSMGNLSPAEVALATRLLSQRRDWADPGGTVDDFSAIELYTSDAGYRALFGIVNESFRSTRFTEQADVVRSAVFLIELLTIDLFNYRLTHPDADGFQGTVYRGMSLSNADVDVFRDIMTKPIGQRYVAVPLGMLSASAGEDVAMHLAAANAKGRGDLATALWRIEVLDLGAELSGIYRTRFPTSIVTSLCAVPITAVSRFPEEREVLLRGPFFQILDVAWQPAGTDRQGTLTIDAVMLNSNRDHLSNIADDHGEDRRMRELFRLLVTHRRAEFATAFTAGRGRTDDSAAYRQQLERASTELQHHLAG